MRLHPSQIVKSHSPSRDYHEAVPTQARHGQIALNSAPGREHRRVCDSPDGLVHLIGRKALERSERACSSHLELGEGREVKQGYTLASGDVFCGNRRRPFSRLPASSRRAGNREGVEQALVCGVPLGTLPSRVLKEDGTQFPLPRIERRQAKVARVGYLLERVDDVVHLAVLLCSPSADVGAAVRVRMKAPYVALSQIAGRLAICNPLSNRLANAASVRNPDGLRRPEPADLRRFAEYGKSIGSKREEAVELTRQSHALETRQHFPRRCHRLLKVRRRERHLGWSNRCFLVVENVIGIHYKRGSC